MGVALELQTLHPLSQSGKVSAVRTTEVAAPAVSVRPTLGSLSPLEGAASGGIPIQLTGAGLGPESGLRCRYSTVTVGLRPVVSDSILDAVAAEANPLAEAPL